ncbi:hypothetical protein NXS19_011519 [Fusarium pseudograminearum]|nr:hypothetical protein NXS19_011519 [Fusarium pseudograminearum]
MPKESTSVLSLPIPHDGGRVLPFFPAKWIPEIPVSLFVQAIERSSASDERPWNCGPLILSRVSGAFSLCMDMALRTARLSCALVYMQRSRSGAVKAGDHGQHESWVEGVSSRSTRRLFSFKEPHDTPAIDQ